MSSLQPAKLTPHQESIQELRDEPDIFGRYHLSAIAVVTKRKPLKKLLKQTWFINNLKGAGVSPDKLSPEAVSKCLNSACAGKLEITPGELDRSLPALAHLSAAAGLNHTEKLMFAFLVNMYDDQDFWLDFVVQLPDSGRKRAVSTLAEVLHLDINQVRFALDTSSRLYKSGLLKHQWCPRNRPQSLFQHFSLFSELLDIHMFRSQHAWEDFLNSKFDKVDQHIDNLNFSNLEKELKLTANFLDTAVAKREKGKHVLLYGPPGTGKTTLARELASRLGLDLYEVRKESGNYHENSGYVRFKAYIFGQKLGVAKHDCLILFDELEDLLPTRDRHQKHKGWICDSLEGAGIPTIWTSNSLAGVDPAILRRFEITLEVPVPPRRLRKALLQNHLAGYKLSPDWLERTSALDCLTPALTAQMASIAHSISAKEDELESALDLWLSERLKAMNRRPLPPVKSGFVFRTELLNANVKTTGISKGLKEFGEGRLCLYGPPGTGKSAFAKFLAEELELEALIHRGSDIRSMWVGKTEQNIARMFADASRNGAVLILDEADSFFSNRLGRNQRWEMNEVSEFLVQLENFQGIFCATTNRFQDLDPAFIRRFDLKIKLDYLSMEQRLMMFKNLLREAGLCARLSSSSNTELISLDQLTPGDFVTAKRRLKFSQQKLSQQSLLSALVHEMECKTVFQSRPIGFR